MKNDHSLWIVPDAHVTPQYDLGDFARFAALGEYLRGRAKRGDALVCLGDFADMPSLSSYERGTRGAEGKRYRDDVEAAKHACKVTFRGMPGVEKHMLLGNHENRINKATATDPAMHGKLSTDDLGYGEVFGKVHPFLAPLSLRGFAFSHYFASGIMGRPIGGENAAASLLSKLHVSAVAGHSHLLDLAVRTSPDGRKLHGIVAGCYAHPKYAEGWCAATRHMWWSGIVRVGQRCERGGWLVTSVEAIGAGEILR